MMNTFNSRDTRDGRMIPYLRLALVRSRWSLSFVRTFTTIDLGSIGTFPAPSQMHLTDRGQGKRLVVELGKQRFRRRSQLGLYRLSDRLRRIGRALDCSFANSSVHSAPRRSGRVLRICPTLMKVAPSSVSALRSRAGFDRSPMRPPSRSRNSFCTQSARTLRIQGARPCFVSVDATS